MLQDNKVYRLTGWGVLMDPLLVAYNSEVYMVSYVRTDKSVNKGDLVFRIVKDDNNVLPLLGGYPPDFYNFYIEPYAFNGEAIELGILAENVSEPFYMVENSSIYFAYVDPIGVNVGRYSFEGSKYYTRKAKRTGNNPVLIRDYIRGLLYLFYIDNNTIWFSTSQDADNWTRATPAPDIIYRLNFNWSRPIVFLQDLVHNVFGEIL